MTDLKPGWRRVKFGEVVRLNKESCKDPETAGINRVIGLEHLEPSDLRVRSWADVADGTTFSNRVRPGQVLFGKRRAYQRKVAVADFDAICSGDIYVFESADSSRLVPDLLPFICQSDSFFDYAIGTSVGSLSPRTNWKSLAEYEFALPPLDEQLLISEIAYSATATINELVNTASSAIKLYHSLALELLQPKAEWETESLERLADASAPICYGIVQLGEPRSDGVPVLRTQNLNGDFADLYFASPELDLTYQRSRVEGGDILIAVQGASTGKIGIVPNGFRGNINRHVARVRLGPGMKAEFFVHLWKSPLFARYATSIAVGSTKPELTIGALRALKVPCPPVPEQQKITNVLNGAMDVVGRLTSRASDLRALRTRFLVSSLGES
jgi:type I restriction enzyme S subunit